MYLVCIASTMPMLNDRGSGDAPIPPLRPGLSPGFPDQEDVTISFPDSIARISCVDLLATLKQCSQVESMASKRGSSSGGLRGSSSGGSIFGGWGGGTRNGSWGGRGREAIGHEVGPLPFQRWELPRGVKGCVDATCLGHAPRDLYTALQGGHDDVTEKLAFCIGEE